MKNKFFCVHAHFYQPPRQNPWTFTVDKESQASPYRDFNRKITNECYGPLSLPAVKSLFADYFLSVYSHISFNFGPTLFSWLQDHYPQLAAVILQADAISSKIYGEGAAIAQAYNHRILPHCSPRDKVLQIKWGIEYFESKFKRKPKALWLPETAVDNETLEALIDSQMEFAILASSQAQPLSGQFTDRSAMEPYYFYSREKSGKKLALFFYNQDLSSRIISEMPNTEKYYLRLFSSFSAENKPEIISIASDGENYGHHLKNGDAALAALLNKIIKEKKFSLCNYASYLKSFPPQKEIKIKERTAWSCLHGLGRWETSCGCRINPSIKNQKWREQLKTFTQELGVAVEKLYERTAGQLLKDPDEAVLSYWKCMDERKPDFILSFIHQRAIRPLTPDETRKILTALEMMKESQFMRTSCAWFFDDISSIEPQASIRSALKIAEAAAGLGEDFSPFFEIIKDARSNYHGITVENIISALKASNRQPFLAVCAFAAETLLKYQTPFENHCDYRLRISRERLHEDGLAIQVSCACISTLAKREFFVNVKKVQENLIFSVKESPLKDFEKNLGLKAGEFDFNCDISCLKDEAGEMARIFLSSNEDDAIKKKFIVSAAAGAGDFEKSLNAFRIISGRTRGKAIFESLPFAQDYLRHFLNLASARSAADPGAEEIVNFARESSFSKMLWKYSMLRGILHDNKKDLLKK